MIRVADWVQNGQIRKALDLCSEVLHSDPEHLEMRATWLDLLDKVTEEHRAGLDQRLGEQPDKAQYWSAKGRFLAQSGRRPEAVECYRKALELGEDPADRSALLALMPSDEAVALVDQTIREDPRDPAIWMDRAALMVAAGKPGEAERCVGQAWSLGLRGQDAVLNVARAWAREGEPDKALELAKRAVELEPKAVAGLVLLAQLQTAAGNFEAAASHTEEAQRLDARDANIWAAKGRLLVAQSRVEEGRRAIFRAVELQPWRGELWDDLGCSYGAHPAALEFFAEARQRNPDNAGVWHHQGRLLLELKRTEEALEAFRQAIRLAPREGRYVADLGAALLGLGRTEEGLATLETSLQLDSRSWKVWHDKAGALERLERLPEALEATEQALALQPQESSLWSHRGALMRALNRPEEALESYERGLRLAPQDELLWLSKGQALKLAGRLDEAWLAWEKAAQLNHRSEALACLAEQQLEGTWEVAGVVVDARERPVQLASGKATMAFQVSASNRAQALQEGLKLHLNALREAGHTVAPNGAVDARYRVQVSVASLPEKKRWKFPWRLVVNLAAALLVLAGLRWGYGLWSEQQEQTQAVASAAAALQSKDYAGAAALATKVRAESSVSRTNYLKASRILFEACRARKDKAGMEEILADLRVRSPKTELELRARGKAPK